MLSLAGCQFPELISFNRQIEQNSAAVVSSDTALPAAPDTSSQPSPQSSATPAIATAPTYPRRPFKLTDQVPKNSSFFKFRQRLQQAIRERDAAFIRAIADPQIKLTFGPAMTLQDLAIDDPNSLFWQRLDRILSAGCAAYEAPADSPIEAWQCPHVSQASLGDPFSDVYIVGEGVNVRENPRTNSRVVAVVSHEVVKSDPSGYDRLSEQQRQELQTDRGWQPIITPAGKRGYVASGYAYTPAGYRARFENQTGQWKMTIFITGD